MLSIVLALAVVGGAWTWLVRSVEGPIEAAATAFLDDVRRGRIDTAWARTNDEYRRTHTLEGFRATMSATPALMTQTGVDIDSVHEIDGIEEVRGTLDTPSGDVPFYVELFEREVKAVWIDGRKLP